MLILNFVPKKRAKLLYFFEICKKSHAYAHDYIQNVTDS